MACGGCVGAVVVSGSWDMLHPGHVKTLKKIKEMVRRTQAVKEGGGGGGFFALTCLPLYVCGMPSSTRRRRAS